MPARIEVSAAPAARRQVVAELRGPCAAVAHGMRAGGKATAVPAAAMHAGSARDLRMQHICTESSGGLGPRKARDTGCANQQCSEAPVGC